VKFVDEINNCESDECSCRIDEVSVFVSNVFKMILNVLFIEFRMNFDVTVVVMIVVIN
jgi:hypothetical protein